MSISRDPSAKRARSRAFTLVEVMLALAILAMLAGALYAVVEGSLRAAAELREKQDRTHEVTAFLSLCRKTFAQLPGSATFLARVVPDGRRYSTEIIFRKAPGFLGWGDPANSYQSTILGVRGQVGGSAGMGILQDSEQHITSYLSDGKADTRPWLILLSGLRDAQWRFYDAGSLTWAKDWSNPNTRPAFAELTLADTDSTQTYVFRIPPVFTTQQPEEELIAPAQ